MPPKPELVVDGAPSHHLSSAFHEIWVFRGTIRAFAERNVRIKYKQAALGIAWAVIQPLTYMAIFSFTIGRLSNVTDEGLPYAAFTLSALVPWTFLSTAVLFGSNAVLRDVMMIRRVYFPREVPVLADVVGASVDFAIGLALFVIVGPILGAVASPWWLLAPVLFFPLAALAAGVAIPLAALNVYYRDFRFIVPFALQLWLFASPVAYPLDTIPDRWQTLYLIVNPAAGILDSFSRVLSAGLAPDWGALGLSILGTILIAVVGYRLFKGLEAGFTDVI